MELVKRRQELEQEIRRQQEVVRRAADDLSEAWRKLASLTAELEALPPPGASVD